MCSCVVQAWGRAWVRFETVRPEGAVPSAIAWMIFGERNASGTRRRTWRSARPSAEAISSNDAVLPARTASIHLRERAIACSRVSCVLGSMVPCSGGHARSLSGEDVLEQRGLLVWWGRSPRVPPLMGPVLACAEWTCPCLVESHYSLVSFVFEIYWAFVTKSRMPADGIIEPVDISGDGIFGLKA